MFDLLVLIFHHLLGSNSTAQSFVNELIAKRNQEIRNKQNKQNNSNNKKPSRRSRGGRNKKSNNNNDSKQQNDPDKIISLDSNKYHSTSKKQTNRHPPSSKKSPSGYRQAGSMTITHAQISKKNSTFNTQKTEKFIISPINFLIRFSNYKNI